MSILEMRGITKRFPGVVALSDVNLAVRAGEIHAVVGENGAGKSTLMKVLSGVYPHGDYEGDIHYEGQVRKFGGIQDSEHAGIIIIHQELALVPLLSIAENIFLGNEPASKLGVIDWFAAYAKTQALLKKVGLNEKPSTLITDIGVGKQQLVEIAKALSKEVKLLILDEPTASLNETDSDALLNLLMGLREQGVSCIIISHKLNEISKVADSITVIRDGSTVRTFDCHKEKVSEDQIIQAMVGREMADRYPKREPKVGETAFEIRDWKVYHPEHADRLFIKGVNLHAKKGEIVGISGLMGAGRTELAMSVFGRSWGRKISGEVLIDGKPVDISTIQKAIDHGLAYVTEDRKGYGLVLNEDIRSNSTLANLEGVSRHTVIDNGQEFSVATAFRQKLRIRCSSISQQVVNLSGGNQQKVVLAKWLFANPEVLILDEPTRGIDVGAKFEIYSLMAELAASGKCVVMISSELPELLGMCDRIYVMNEGRFVGEFTGAEASQEKIMRSIVTAGANDGCSTNPHPSAAAKPVNPYAGFLKNNLRDYGMLMSLVVIMAFFWWMTDGTLLEPLNLTNLILQNSYIVIMALGMLLVIVAGHIDLSVGSVVGFVGALAAVLMVDYHWHFVPATIVCLIAGAIIGAIQGYFVAFFSIPSFIVTLAGMLVFRGLNLALLQGQSVGPFDPNFQLLSSGFIPDWLNGETMRTTSLVIGIIVAVLLMVAKVRERSNQSKHGMESEPFPFFIGKNIFFMAIIIALSWKLAGYKGLPNVLVVMTLLMLFYDFVTSRTTIGRRIYALGGNEKAARLSGVKTKWLSFYTFVNMGVLAAVAGMVFAARLNTATPKAGLGFELDVIAACFIGGASASGGVGKVLGAVIGAFIMGVMNNGMSILGIGIDYQQVIKGLVLLAAVFVDVYNKSKS